MKRILIILYAVFILASCGRLPDYPSPRKGVDERTIRAYARASEMYALGNFAETIEILREEKKFHPALLLRAKAEFFAGDLDSAEKACEKAIKARPTSFEARLYLARVLREKEDLAGAVTLSESLLADNPQDIRALRLAADLALVMGKNDAASAFLDRACESSAENAMVLLDRARLRWTSGKGTEALEDLSRAKAMLPWDTPLTRTISNLERAIRYPTDTGMSM